MKIISRQLKVTCSFLLLLSFLQASSQVKNVALQTLTNGQKLNGFKATALYLNGSDQPMGARFIHERTGFTLDLLQIESVPQTFIYTNTIPVSDKGEPHTQEHLLITKGNKGRQWNTMQAMSLAASNAYTQQTHTSYHFYTGAGPDVFFNLFNAYMDALLHPNYTDEEIRREVRNWGIAENPGDKSLRIEEKGAVYNEMNVSMNNQQRRVYMMMQQLVYGKQHPLSFSAGGLPASIREMTPEDIKKYHAANYHLANMGAITSLPKNVGLGTTLSKMNTILNNLEPKTSKLNFLTEDNMPAPMPAEAGKIALAEFPSRNAQEPGNMFIAFPAERNVAGADKLLLDLFLGTFSNGATSNLYKKFIDTKTRTVDLGPSSSFGFIYDYKGQPVIFGLGGVPAANLTQEKAALARQEILNELNRVASFADNSPELKEFNERVRNNLVDEQRSLNKFISTPPKFGFRNTGDGWYNTLEELNKTASFKKSLIQKPELSAIEKQLQSGKNIWKEYIAKWKLNSTQPYVVYSKANPALLDELEASRKQRAKDEIARLKTKYSVKDDQEAIRKYKEEYDNNTTAIEKNQDAVHVSFISNPPLTLDDNLDYKVSSAGGKVKMVSSTFNNMSGATTGIALKLQGVPQDKLVYLAILPDLLTGTGYIKNGKAVSYEDMSQQLQKEILSLQSNYSTNITTGRAELVVKGAGNNATEAQRALEWMNTVLQSPNWKIENISRIQDLVEQSLSGIRRTMQGPEERWVNDPGDAYVAQDNPLMLATSSFLTRSHNIFRLKWMLKSAGDESTKKAIDKFLKNLADLNAERDQLKLLVNGLQTGKATAETIPEPINEQFNAFNILPAGAKLIAADAAKDLEQILNEIPDGSLAADWSYLCNEIRKDLAQSPEQTLADLDNVRKSLLMKGNARMFVIGSAAVQQKLAPNINSLLAGLQEGTSLKANYSTAKMIDERLKGRMKKADAPVYVGLINPNSQTGVFINSAPLVTYKDTTREQLLRFLAGELYAGAGKQSVYTKSTGAGLSYSTGIAVTAGNGRIRYYAERTPELPQTLKFIIDEIKRSPKDTAMKDYIISLAMSATRAASDYEDRGEAMASSLEDDLSPATVKAFRSAILKLRKMPGLVDEVYNRKDQVYQTILPGYGAPVKDANGVYFVIGPEKQMSLYEAYLKAADNKDAKLYRLYPRDYWMAN
jgi:Zn-dependent M16 (insulinase) family peptidase